MYDDLAELFCRFHPTHRISYLIQGFNTVDDGFETGCFNGPEHLPDVFVPPVPEVAAVVAH